MEMDIELNLAPIEDAYETLQRQETTGFVKDTELIENIVYQWKNLLKQVGIFWHEFNHVQRSRVTGTLRSDLTNTFL